MDKIKKFVFLLLSALLLTSCFYSEVDDADIAPDVSDVAGCWFSTKNVAITKTDYDVWEDVRVVPTSTCKEICINKDLSFSLVSVIQGTSKYDHSREVAGRIRVLPVDEIGAGKSAWTMRWTSKDLAYLMDSDTATQKYYTENEAEIRLVGGKLYGVSLGVSDLYNPDEEGERKYSRTKDEKFCDSYMNEEVAK